MIVSLSGPDRGDPSGSFDSIQVFLGVVPIQTEEEGVETPGIAGFRMGPVRTAILVQSHF